MWRLIFHVSCPPPSEVSGSATVTLRLLTLHELTLRNMKLCYVPSSSLRRIVPVVLFVLDAGLAKIRDPLNVRNIVPWQIYQAHNNIKLPKNNLAIRSNFRFSELLREKLHESRHFADICCFQASGGV